MNQFLRDLSPAHQVAALFILVFGVLAIVSTVTFFISLRERRNALHTEAWQRELKDFQQLLSTTWFMAVVFWIGWALGEGVATFLFALISFLSLREFITLSPTRRGDHRSLILAFFRGAADPVHPGRDRALRSLHRVSFRSMCFSPSRW